MLTINCKWDHFIMWKSKSMIEFPLFRFRKNCEKSPFVSNIMVLGEK